MIAKNILPYLLGRNNMVVTAQSKSLFGLSEMLLGSTPRDGGGSIFLDDEYKSTLSQYS